MKSFTKIIILISISFFFIGCGLSEQQIDEIATRAAKKVEPVKGETGKAGANGKDGEQGKAGTDGTQGPQGTKGDDGAKGETGGIGPQGPKGEKGEVKPLTEDEQYDLNCEKLGKKSLRFFGRLHGDKVLLDHVHYVNSRGVFYNFDYSECRRHYELKISFSISSSEFVNGNWRKKKTYKVPKGTLNVFFASSTWKTKIDGYKKSDNIGILPADKASFDVPESDQFSDQRLFQNSSLTALECVHTPMKYCKQNAIGFFLMYTLKDKVTLDTKGRPIEVMMHMQWLRWR